MEEKEQIVLAKMRVPGRPDRSAPYAYALVAAFILTYGLVMFGDRLGIMEHAPRTAAEMPATQAPIPN